MKDVFNRVSIPERFLRQLWKRQEFTTSSLTTVDSKPLTIFSPGTFNADAGPDFLDALVKIGDITYRGDVELHQTLEEWKVHAHDKDPRYNRVVLHVVFDAGSADIPSLTKSKRTVPVLILKPYLTGPYRDIWRKMIFDERAERIAYIKCYRKNHAVEQEIITAWLKKLATERMELKIRRFDERLRQLAEWEELRIQEPPTRYGEIPFGVSPEDLPPPAIRPSPKLFAKTSLWSQLLYEGIFEALGFSKNREPFLRLAQNVPLERIMAVTEQHAERVIDPTTLAEAYLFGAAGLLEVDLRPLDSATKQYVRQLRSIWKSIRPTFAHEVLDPSDWKFFRLRPDNFPTVRIAGAARFLTRSRTTQLLRAIVQTIKAEQSPKEKHGALESLFIVPADGFWQTHYHFGHDAKRTLSTLIGKSRANEIIANVVVPIALLYARMFKDRDARHGALQIFQHSPPLSENSITKIIAQQLIKNKLTHASAMMQQGMLQLYKYYCVEERCGECAVGKVVFYNSTKRAVQPDTKETL